MNESFTQRARTVLLIASESAAILHQSSVGVEHILLGLLRYKGGVATLLEKRNIDDRHVLDILRENSSSSALFFQPAPSQFSPVATKILSDSHAIARWFHAEATDTEHLLLAILKDNNNIAVRIFKLLGVEPHLLYIDVISLMAQKHLGYGFENNNKDTHKQTENLDKFSKDLTAMAKEKKLDPIIGRDRELRRVMQSLSRRNKNNPCLIGEPGVGKSAIVEGLAIKIVEGDVPENIAHKRLVNLDLSGIVAGCRYRGDFEERIKSIIDKVITAGDIIIFIDEVHTIIGAGGSEGAIDASNILKPYLARGDIQLIGATTLGEYRKYIEKDPALDRRFQPVLVEEPTVQEAIKIMKGISERYESYHNVKILPEALEASVKLTERYINDRNLPDKAIDAVDEASAATKLNVLKHPRKLKLLNERIALMEKDIDKLIDDGSVGEAEKLREEKNSLEDEYEKQKSQWINRLSKKRPVIDEKSIAEVISAWANVPVERLTVENGEKLINLEAILQQRIIGQRDAIAAVSKAVRRGRTGIRNPNRPIGSFLFLGPTGVGKTELSKVLAEEVFENKKSFIRVDMSEYMEPYSVSKIIGSPPGYVGFEEGGQLCEKVRRNPYSLILFDEIEKAHPDVYNILLQILDDGHITDSKGRRINFKNTIIIMTSNIGSKSIIRQRPLGFVSEITKEQSYENMRANVMDEVNHVFKPEFINRIDDVVVFHSLDKENMKEIITLLTSDMVKRCKEESDINIIIKEEVKEYLVTKYSDITMGARPLKRAVQREIEDLLAELLLSKDIAPGSRIAFSIQEDKITTDIKKARKRKKKS